MSSISLEIAKIGEIYMRKIKFSYCWANRASRRCVRTYSRSIMLPISKVTLQIHTHAPACTWGDCYPHNRRGSTRDAQAISLAFQHCFHWLAEPLYFKKRKKSFILENKFLENLFSSIHVTVESWISHDWADHGYILTNRALRANKALSHS